MLLLGLRRRDWLGGLDSNQDNQIQNLMYCQLYDLPADGENKSGPLARPENSLTGAVCFVNRRAAAGNSKTFTLGCVAQISAL